MIPTKVIESLPFDLSVPYTVMVIDVRAYATCAIALESTDAIGAAVLTVSKSYDGGATLVEYASPPAMNATTASVEMIDCSVAPYLVVRVTTAGTSGTYGRLRGYLTAINNAGGI